MRFEVSYPTGMTHEVELTGATAVLGRDPACDVVLNDTKCSRRHAVLEEGDGRLVVRDTGSANGIYVNGRRVDKALLAPGDTVRLGDVQLRVLAEVGATVVMAATEELSSPVAVLDAPPARAETPRPGGGARGAGPGPERRSSVPARRAPLPPVPSSRPVPPLPADAAGRPLTVTLLALLWALFVPASVAGVLYGASRAGAGPAGWALAAVASAALAGLGVAMALGLRSLAPWAHRLQVVTAGLGLLACPVTLASVTVLLYMTRPEVKQAFSPRRPGGPGAGASEPTFALSILAMLGVGLGVAAVALLLGGRR